MIDLEININFHFPYLYPALVADLLENWHLPLTDFMQRVETYYGLDTRLKLDRDSVVTRQSLRVAELHLYGSSRLGIYKTQDTLRTVDLNLVYKPSDVNIAPTQTHTKKEFYSFDSTYTHQRGDKLYEGSNHLGNVLVTFSDKRLATCTEGQLNYQADVRSATDYAAFGALLDDRQWYSGLDSGGYRAGFNGMEKDDDAKGLGNSYFTEYRILDPRLCRWLSLDPAQQLLPGLTPYNSLSNSPIAFVDPDGLWHRKTTGNGEDKREHLVADKGDELESLEKYFNKRRNRKRFTDDQKNLIRKEVEAYGQANATWSVRTLSGTPSYAGFDLNLSEKVNLSINIHVGRTSLIGNDPYFKSLYYSRGGHVGVEFEGIVYNYFYEDPSSYDPNNPFALYSGKMRMEPAMDYIYGGNGDHSYANGDMDRDGIPDVKGADSYFTVYLTTGQYAKMRARTGKYAANPTGVPQYGIFGKRCTSMANTMLRKSDVRVVFMSSFRTSHPHQYYNALKKKRYAETVVR